MPATATAPTAAGAEAACPENRVKALDVLTWPRVGVRSLDSPDRCWENRPWYDGKAVGTVLARYYDPATGQFLTVDPKVATTLSPYGYVEGDPLNSEDPTGLDNCGLFAFFCDAVATAGNAVGSQAVSWAGDINNFGNTHTIGLCAVGSIGLIVGVTASGCVAVNFHSAGFTGTFGGGLDLPGGADLGVGPMFSNAHSVSELGGAFEYAGASGGEEYTGNAEFGGGVLPCGRSVQYGWIGAGVGVNVPLPLPGSVWAGASNTWTASTNW